MANTLTNAAPVWICATPGVISTVPVVIKKALLNPNAAADLATFVSWYEPGSKKATMSGKTATVTSTKTITSTGNFETAEVAAGDILKIYTSVTTGNNMGTYIVDTRDSDDAVTIETGNTLTNEVSSVYSWWTLTPFVTIPLVSPGTEKIQWWIDFGSDGLHLPNLALQAISTSAIAYLYV